MTNEVKNSSEAFNAILDEAHQLLKLAPELPAEIVAGLERIISIARHKADVRTEEERVQASK